MAAYHPPLSSRIDAYLLPEIFCAKFNASIMQDDHYYYLLRAQQAQLLKLLYNQSTGVTNSLLI